MICSSIFRISRTAAYAGLLLTLWPTIAQALSQHELPVWRALEFERKAFWATARSYVDLQEDNCDYQRWKL
ncbi:MAG: hypothetical protein AB8C02_08230, partial [Halioglobus sp.]